MNNGNNTSSIASLVCGIVSLFVLPFIFGIASIILGIVAISKQEEKKNYAIIAILLGIISILWAFYSTGML